VIFGFIALIVATGFWVLSLAAMRGHQDELAYTADALAGLHGNALRGARAYRTTCASCHGQTGHGVVNMGLPLRGSAFIAQADDDQLHRLIVRGRQASDPASRMRRRMPPRGGNPFLKDAQVHDIIALLRQWNDGHGGTGKGGDAAGPEPTADATKSAAGAKLAFAIH
jgi:mono/diheme cytochrome c family protein